jgi:hypothetical protein
MKPAKNTITAEHQKIIPQKSDIIHIDIQIFNFQEQSFNPTPLSASP